MNRTDRLETPAGQLFHSLAENSTPDSECQKWHLCFGISLCLRMSFMALFMYVNVYECLFLKSQTHILQEEYWHFRSH